MDDGSPNGYFSQNPNQSQTQSGGRRRQKHPGDYLALLDFVDTQHRHTTSIPIYLGCWRCLWCVTS